MHAIWEQLYAQTKLWIQDFLFISSEAPKVTLAYVELACQSYYMKPWLCCQDLVKF